MFSMTVRNSVKSVFLRFSALCLAVLMVLCPVFALAESFEEMYGPELKSIPYAYRVRYANEYGKAWSEATYDERSQFLDLVYQEEFQEAIANENLENQETMIENQKQMQREAERVAEEQRELDKELRKNDQKVQAQMKKYELQMKSMEQKQKILNMRYQQ